MFNSAGGSGQELAILDDKVTQARDLGNQIKRRIEALKKQPAPRGQEARKNQVCAFALVTFQGCSRSLAHSLRYRNEQVNVVAKQFMTALQNYTKVEQDYRQKQRSRVERQFKIGQLCASNVGPKH